MYCPVCRSPSTKVLDSRDSSGGIRRRRMCSECGHRFTTRERIEESAPVVLKRDGKREPFDRAKLLRGLEIACRKRPVSPDALEAIVSAIEQWANTRGDREVTSDEVGERAMHHLHELDQVAYVRFVSVYRSFETIEEFAALLAEMEKAERVDNAGQRELFAELEAAASHGGLGAGGGGATVGPLAARREAGSAGTRDRGLAGGLASDPALSPQVAPLHGPRDRTGA